MSVVSVTEDWSKVNCAEEKARYSAPWKLTAQRGFNVVFDAISYENQTLAIAATDGVTTIPALLASFSATYPDVRLRRKTPRLKGKNPYVFEVVCEYGGEDSPLTVPAEKGWDADETEEEVDDDANGDAVVNPLGDRITGFTRPFFDGLYTYTRNEATSANCRPNSYRGSTNSDTVTLDGFSCAAGTLCMRRITGQRVADASDAYYWRVTYVIAYRADGWKKRLLCQGNYYWTGAYKGDGSKYTLPCVADDGVTPRTRPLTATGLLLPDGDDHVWIEADRYSEVAWSALALT